ncbi:unnamed protein product, partial [Allacma fusca]
MLEYTDSELVIT